MGEDRNLPDTVIVTGGNGRIGRRVVEDLRRQGRRVVSLVRRRSGGSHPDDLAVELTNSADVKRAIEGAGATALLHLASVLRGDDLESMNVQIHRAVADGIRSTAIRRVVHASSGAVYGVAADAARTEESSLDTTSSYARAKLKEEALLGALTADDPDICVASLRIFNVAGPDFPDSLVQRLVRASPSKPVTVIGPDRFTRDYIHQDDVIEVLRIALEQNEPGHRIVNVGAGVPVTTRMLLERLEVDPAAVIELPGEVNANWADNSKMLRLFGVQPRSVPDRSWDGPHAADSRFA